MRGFQWPPPGISLFHSWSMPWLPVCIDTFGNNRALCCPVNIVQLPECIPFIEASKFWMERAQKLSIQTWTEIVYGSMIVSGACLASPMLLSTRLQLFRFKCAMKWIVDYLKWWSHLVLDWIYIRFLAGDRARESIQTTVNAAAEVRAGNGQRGRCGSTKCALCSEP